MSEEEQDVWVFTLESTSFKLVQRFHDLIEEMGPCPSSKIMSYGWHHKGRKAEREITTADTDFADHLGKPEMLDERRGKTRKQRPPPVWDGTGTGAKPWTKDTKMPRIVKVEDDDD